MSPAPTRLVTARVTVGWESPVAATRSPRIAIRLCIMWCRHRAVGMVGRRKTGVRADTARVLMDDESIKDRLNCLPMFALKPHSGAI